MNINKKIRILTTIFLFFVLLSVPVLGEFLGVLPDIKPIVTDHPNYTVGDTVTITLEGIPNPDGKNTIDGFLLDIRYGTGSGFDFVEDFDDKYVTASGNMKTISFVPAKGDTYITIEATAFDYPSSQGGLMSEKATRQIWIKEYVNPIAETLPNSEHTEDTPTSNNLGTILIMGIALVSLLLIILILIVIKIDKRKK